MSRYSNSWGGIFHVNDVGPLSAEVGSQTLIIIAMTVMTGKLSIKYMVVFMHMLAGQVSFMMRICNRSMQEQVLHIKNDIIIIIGDIGMQDKIIIHC